MEILNSICSKWLRRCYSSSLRRNALRFRSEFSTSKSIKQSDDGGDNNELNDGQHADEPIITLREDLQTYYDIAKVVFPYDFPLRLSNKMRRELNNSTFSQRNRLFEYYNNSEKSTLKKKFKSLERSAAYQEYKATRGDYQLPNCLFLWTRTKEISTFKVNNSIYGDKFGNDLVVDCRFEHMFQSGRDLMPDYIRNINKIIDLNSKSREPFRLWLCNVAADSVLHKELEKSLYVVRVTPKSYLDVFKKQDLCYLSPDTREVLDPLRMPKDVVYILGGLPDMAGQFEKESFATAKKEGVKCRTLPVKKYLYCTGKVMPLASAFETMKTYDSTGDMCKAIHASYSPRLVFSYIHADGSRTENKEPSEEKKPMRKPNTGSTDKYVNNTTQHGSRQNYHVRNKPRSAIREGTEQSEDLMNILFDGDNGKHTGNKKTKRRTNRS